MLLIDFERKICPKMFVVICVKWYYLTGDNHDQTRPAKNRYVDLVKMTLKKFVEEQQ